MIIPNLLCTDITRSIQFYRDILGLKLGLTVDADRNFSQDGSIVEDPVFAILEWQDAQIMLQTAASLSDELEQILPDQAPSASGTVYFRGFDGSQILSRLPEANVLKGPDLNWYGMKEIYVQDPDGYILCLGIPEGEFQSS